jgi:3-deoxy-D-manno-octulosonic acid kinase
VTAQPLTLRRYATSGAAGEGAIFSNAAAGFEPPAAWFEPRYWIARGAMIGEARGRGTTHFFEAEGRRYALRHYRRGGLMSRLMEDRYVWRGESATRPVRELRLTMQMHADGLPVPVPIGARYRRDGLLYRGDLITELLPDTETLAQRLDRGDVGLGTWAAIGRCLRRFHDLGYCHADLNAHNVMLGGADEVFLIDFDRGTRRSQGLWRDANLTRLLRSLEKLEDRRRQPRFDAAQWQCLLSAWLG